MQSELDKGVSLDDVRKKIAKGDVQKKVSKQLKHKQYFRTEKIQRKGRDLNKLICKHVADLVEPKSKSSTEPRALTTLEIYAKAKEEEETTPIFSKKTFKLEGSAILVSWEYLSCSLFYFCSG